MADYFDELGFRPVPAEETQQHQTLLMVRFLQQHGAFAAEFQAEQLPPPASKELVRNLKERKPSKDDEKCSICLKPHEENDEIFKILPCSHEFHQSCILPWLNKTNSCPLCRYEMETDDPDYEEQKRFRLRQQQRETELEHLHNSMFG